MPSNTTTPARVYVGRTEPDLAGELARGLDFIGWERIIPPGARVAIQPNFCWPERLNGVTTRPEVLEAVVSAVATRTPYVAVVESDGISYPAEEAWTAHDAPAICARHGATLVNLSRHPAERRRVRVGGREIEFSSYLLNDVDVLISLPVLKTHVIATLSLGMKNLWGCLPSSMRILSHHVLAPGIVALSQLHPPAITIIDATFGLDRRGPVFGDSVPVGRLVVANNVVAADATGARLLGFDPRAIEHLRLAAETGLHISPPADPFESQAARDGLVEASGALKVVAVSLTKIANDLRLMGSGPRAGLAELFLPELQKGSSIMPGKVNPVIPEVVTQVAAQVIGNDQAITVGGLQGHFELNVFIPMMARNLLGSITLLASASRLLAEKCVDGIEANREQNERYAELTLSAATALNPHIGYDKASEIVKKAAATGRSLREVAREEGVDDAILDEALDYRRMAKPHG